MLKEVFLHAGIIFVCDIIGITSIECSSLTKAVCGNRYLRVVLLSSSSIIIINGRVKGKVFRLYKRPVLVELW